MEKFFMDLADSEAFRLGLVFGGLGLVAGGLVAGLMRRTPQPPIGGLLFAAAALGAMWLELRLPGAVVVGAAALVAGVMLGTEVWDRALGALPGAVIIVYFGDAGSRVAAAVIVLAIAVGSALVSDFDHEFRRSGLGLPLLAGSVVGLIVTVPDTKFAFALLAAALPLILLGWPKPLISLGPGAAAAVGIIGWVAAQAGNGRPGAAIGAIAALGLMLGEPIGRRLSGSSPNALLRLAAAGPSRALILVAIHAVLVFGAARIAGLNRGALAALAVSAPFIALGALLGAAPDPRLRPERQPVAD